jgi:hypothetical protein
LERELAGQLSEGATLEAGAAQPSLMSVTLSLMTVGALVVGGAIWLPSPGPDSATGITGVYLASESVTDTPRAQPLSDNDRALNALLLSSNRATVGQDDEPKVEGEGGTAKTVDTFMDVIRAPNGVAEGTRKPENPQAVTQRPTTSKRPAEPSGQRDLNAERELLDQARSALGSGARTRALRILRQHLERHRRGFLAEERESLWVRVLADQGKVKDAQRRARRFLKRYPRSVHRARVERVLKGALP